MYLIALGQSCNISRQFVLKIIEAGRKNSLVNRKEPVGTIGFHVFSSEYYVGQTLYQITMTPQKNYFLPKCLACKYCWKSYYIFGWLLSW